jgi:cytochrome bd-type quinol oxidase subunit 2
MYLTGGLLSFINRSIKYSWKQFSLELTKRKILFNEYKTPKKVFSFWFFIFALGQIGIITSILWAAINGDSLSETIAQQGRSGNFLTFEISLILSCLVYYFDEYGDDSPKALLFLRVTLLVFAMLVAFLAMLNYIYINSNSSPSCWSIGFTIYNVFLYVIGVFLSYLMYITFSVVEPTAADDMKSKTEAAVDAANSIAATDVANISDKKINL